MGKNALSLGYLRRYLVGSGSGSWKWDTPRLSRTSATCAGSMVNATPVHDKHVRLRDIHKSHSPHTMSSSGEVSYSTT